nr:DUF4384 domain-containing protein [Gammaproteobacteria bacterium]
KSEPRSAITNFSKALSCMDDLFVRYNISGLLVGAQDIPDATSAVSAGAKDMLITAFSKMSLKSNAIRFVALGADLSDITVFHDLHANKSFQSPDFFIRGGVTQADQGVVEKQTSGGIALADAFSLEGSKDRVASIISLDMNIGIVSSLQILPGISSSNSIAVARRGKGLDATAQVKKLGAIFNFNYSQNEGLHHALRTLIELGVIELMGKLTQVPYWECLDVETTNTLVQTEIREWYGALSDEEIRIFVQAKLRSKGMYDGEVDGKDSPSIRTAIALYKAEQALTADSKLDYLLYYNLLADKTPIEEDFVPLLVREYVVPTYEGPEKESHTTKIVPQTLGLPDTALTPLDFTLAMDRGAKSLYTAGESGQLIISPTVDAHLVCFYEPTPGEILKIFPNDFQANSLVRADSTLTIPATDDFLIQFENPDAIEKFLCLASYDEEVNRNTIAELRVKNLQPIDLARVGQIYQREITGLADIEAIYRSTMSTVPLSKTIRVRVQ